MNDPLVVLISGKIGSGKNTLADMLLHELGEKAKGDAFARPLKEFCRDTLKPVTDYLNVTYLGCGPSGKAIKEENWFEKKTPLTRLFLQVIGTEVVRKVDNDYWIKQTLQSIRKSKESIFILTDWRFPNEYDKINKEFHTFTIRVNRDIPREGEAHKHISETALDNRFEYNQIIDNEGTLQELRSCAAEIAYLLTQETMV